MHPAIRKGSVAVITGAAAGIGFAIANRVVTQGMSVALFDRDPLALGQAVIRLHSAHPGAQIHAIAGDVTDEQAIRQLVVEANELGDVSLLVNNAAVITKAGPWESSDAWQHVIDVNFNAALRLQQSFVPRMLERAGPSAVVNLGSKEGITTPPGNTAYNVSKAALRVLTEQLAHELRERSGHVTAHLLIPGYTFTPMNFPGMTPTTEKPAAPWTANQVAERLVEGMALGQFYIFCEDNEVSRELDRRRMQWSADDLIQNRPALSRWHPDFRDLFAAYVKGA